jgi:hypothetical protein
VYQVSETTRTVDDALCGQEHRHCQSAREYDSLSRVQEGQRRRDLYGGFFVFFEVLVILRDFVFLVVEVLPQGLLERQRHRKIKSDLDGLEIDQGIDS